MANIHQPILGSDFLTDSGITVNSEYIAIGSPKCTHAALTQLDELSMQHFKIHTTGKPISQKLRRMTGAVLRHAIYPNE